ncbi:O-antigen acetylase [Minicystis rosea]|nr:O-antigen acetylase [Minicystis rosea]
MTRSLVATAVGLVGVAVLALFVAQAVRRAPSVTPSGSPPGGDDTRIDQFDGIRTLAFLSVFVHHLTGMRVLWAGVDVFFVLSGFLITGILLRQRTSERYFRTFYFRRFLRIFPPYYVILGVTFFLFGAACRAGLPWYLLYLSNFRDAFVGSTCSPLTLMWSLAIEEQFYLLWPLIVWLVGERRLARVAVLLVAGAPLLRLGLTFLTTRHFVVYMLLPTRVDLLAAGALLVVLSRTEPDLFRRLSRVGPLAAVGAIALFVLLAKLDPTFRTGANAPLFNALGYSLICIAAVGIVAYTAVRRENVYFRILTSRPMIFLGKISYMMYLCHQLVLDLVARLGLPRPLTGLLALALVIGWSTLSWYLLEKPLQTLKDRYPARPVSAT